MPRSEGTRYQGLGKRGDFKSASGIREHLLRFIRQDPRNRLPEYEHLPIFEEPLAGVANAGDPLFEGLRSPSVVGPLHRSPGGWLSGALSVVSYFLPFSREIKGRYAKGERLPPLEWVSGRLNGEMFNNALRRALVIFFEKRGFRAMAPGLSPDYRALNWIPMWSERHAAHIAGLGTFGLSGCLLTEKGAAGRIGSIVTDAPLEATKRAYQGPFDYCPYKTGGGCGACIKSCPVGAVGPGGEGPQGLRFQRAGLHPPPLQRLGLPLLRPLQREPSMRRRASWKGGPGESSGRWRLVRPGGRPIGRGGRLRG